jgi:periplasmic divalent cation tolerance protein
MILVYITCANLEEAKNIARTVVTEKLAACANIFPQIHSIYSWEGEICEDSEAIIILKAQAENYEKLSKRVTELHSYDCPCVIAIDVKQANAEYLSWLVKSC